MAKRMLIDATHPEETRVVVHSGSRLEEFDYETVSKKQLKGNIYLAKITRVEPSLQAAFVEYGGNRHGFLPFSEIHPDYYRIPIADREALLAEEKALKSSSRSDDEEPVENGNGDVADTDADGATAGNDTAEQPSEAASADTETQDAAANGEDSAVDQDDTVEEIEGETSVDTLSGDDDEEAAERSRARLLRKYKIQEVIKRRQVILVQVAKEERGNKGAALTTYLSLAGRYCVLMPNTNKGGGISRKISNASDRRRLKEILSELKIPDGIAVIVRTAGSQRNKTEIRRDYEYLMRLWNEIRELTLRSTAPALIHEEANLIKRAIRDLYSRDMEDVLVEGESSYKAAKSFMRTLMPSHAKKVQLYKDPSIPLFHRYKVEGQLDAMHNPTVQLRSGGYIVINPTEALVAVDVNSGKATRERHIEETALKTNLEAADEVARQVRLRDLAGLVVVDFIDMEESRHNREVERRLKEAMKNDRARIQLGRISPFGLLEMSRQRLRPSLVENSTLICPSCQGVGTVRTTESTALHVLRAVEEEGIRRSGGRVLISVPTAVALYMLNQKRARLFDIEERYNFEIEVSADDNLTAPDYSLDRLDEQGERVTDQRAERPAERSRERGRDRQASKQRDDEDARTETVDESDESGDRKRSRRRRRRKRDDEATASPTEDNLSVVDDEDAAETTEDASVEENGESDDEDGKSRKRRRRGKRGGRRRSRRKESGDEETLDGEASGTVSSEDESTEAQDSEGSVRDQDGQDDAIAASDSTSQDAAVTDAAPLETAAPVEAPAAESETEDAPKPKRRRSRSPRRTAKAEPEVVEAEQAAAAEQSAGDEPVSAEPVAAETVAASSEVNETAAEEQKPEATPKKRASRSRSTTAKTPRSRSRKPAAAKKAAAETVSEESAPTDSPVVETRQPEPVPNATEIAASAEPAAMVAQENAGNEAGPAQVAPGAATEPVSETATANAGDSETEDDGPKRRGWWSRWV
ncbi:ribonuclease E/G [Pelagibius sp. Alg239-R121]|uniref:ribonuclease E/G n=1 Tax=Pelagibius sp. Alg239-R121 TaxID=2993448 RepID=UPI0024A6868D|nr:ribonuclease E/G [Pelagibius sp. Alg239-R121]